MTSATELLPCPFCGGEAYVVSDYSSEHDETRWSLWHECCEHDGESAGYGHALFPWFETPWYKTEAEAIAAWNTRTELLDCNKKTIYDWLFFAFALEHNDLFFEFIDKLSSDKSESGTCKPTEEGFCPICGEDLVKCNVGIGELGGAVELDPPIYHNYCPNCGKEVTR